MVEDLTKFQCILVNHVSSRRFFFVITDYVFINGVFSVSHDVLAFSRRSSFGIKGGEIQIDRERE